MNVGNCPRCGRIYQKNPRNLCPICVKEDEEMYQKVYNYLRKNPKSTVQQVSEATGVPEDRILAYLRDGRVQATEWLKFDYPCERCGSKITTGRYCDRCAQELQIGLQGAASQIRASKQQPKAGYHIDKNRPR